MNRRSLAAAFLLLLAAAIPLQAQWLDGWEYRRPVTVGNPCGETLANHQARVDLDGSFDFTRALPDGADLRVTSADGTTQLPFWIEQWDAVGQRAAVWAVIPELPPAGATVYIYYGKSDAVAAVDGSAAFPLFYDGFEGIEAGGVPGSGMDNPGEWARHSGNPMIAPGPPGAWDDHGATYASVIWDETAGEYRMYYHGFSETQMHQIGLAVSGSLDGPWTRLPAPVLTPGPAAWDGQSVRVPMVWKEGPTDYRMIYTGQGSGGMQVGYATSTDGLAWTRHPGNPVFNDPTWATGQTQNWGVMKVGSEYLMWYGNFVQRESGIAVSTDLVNWTPHTTAPVFASSGDPGDDRYSQYCPFSFSHDGDYYVLVPSYDAGANFGRVYLYRSSSPYFPEADRQLVRVALTVGQDGQWDDHDLCTPFVFTGGVDRIVLPGEDLRVFYSGEEGDNIWAEGLVLEADPAAALADAGLPSTGTNWTTTGDVTVTDTPVRQGLRSVRQNDTSLVAVTQLRGAFTTQTSGVVSAWMRRSAATEGDYDIYLYAGTTLAAVAGLGRDGDFHSWDGSFQPTGIAWSPDTWYLVSLAFDTDMDQYDLFVEDQNLDELVRVAGVAFGNPAGSIDSAVLYTSSLFQEEGFADDVRLRAWCGAEPGITIGLEETTGTVGAQLTCIPASGILPFTVQFTARLTNRYTGQIRRLAARVNLTMGSGGHITSWRAGFTNVAPGDSYVAAWNQNLPALGTLLGENLFRLSAEDVTPAPYNQPPYPAAGDTATAACTVTGVAP
jgi:hypothetical protein